MLGYPPPPRPAARHAGIPPAMHAGIAPLAQCMLGDTVTTSGRYASYWNAIIVTLIFTLSSYLLTIVLLIPCCPMSVKPTVTLPTRSLVLLGLIHTRGLFAIVKI